MNVINNIHYDIVNIINKHKSDLLGCIYVNDVMIDLKNVTFTDDYVKRVADDILRKTGNKYDKEKMAHAVADIPTYMTELELYEYLPKLYVLPICSKKNGDLGM